ncbi:hypothetical protein H8B02_20995 [Bradyrhizobium sp. Pear77]|uniref:hypothetical protein n=1 Tax=Bradyrhizobium altum TaxID=1571202 RepID=UPI001E3BCB62|nr:hypothetical protein [Bradyrhizobium altum]MCC8955816.1 hypothetical protein [Bradyrhizobium altum]
MILTSFWRVYVPDSIIVLPSQEMPVVGMGAARSARERRRATCALSCRDISKCRVADGAKQRSRRGTRPDVRHKDFLLGGAAEAVVRGWLENDGD